MSEKESRDSVARKFQEFADGLSADEKTQLGSWIQTISKGEVQTYSSSWDSPNAWTNMLQESWSE